MKKNIQTIFDYNKNVLCSNILKLCYALFFYVSTKILSLQIHVSISLNIFVSLCQMFQFEASELRKIIAIRDQQGQKIFMHICITAFVETPELYLWFLAYLTCQSAKVYAQKKILFTSRSLHNRGGQYKKENFDQIGCYRVGQGRQVG